MNIFLQVDVNRLYSKKRKIHYDCNEHILLFYQNSMMLASIDIYQTNFFEEVKYLLIHTLYVYCKAQKLIVDVIRTYLQCISIRDRDRYYIAYLMLSCTIRPTPQEYLHIFTFANYMVIPLFDS